MPDGIRRRDAVALAATTAVPGLIVHHDDAEREVAYGHESGIGKLDRGLSEAAARGWTVVSMRADWTTVFND